MSEEIREWQVWQMRVVCSESRELEQRRCGVGCGEHIEVSTCGEKYEPKDVCRRICKIMRAMTHVERASCYRHHHGIGIPLNRADLAAGRCRCPNSGVRFSVFWSLRPCSFSLRVLRPFFELCTDKQRCSHSGSASKGWSLSLASGQRIVRTCS